MLKFVGVLSYLFYVVSCCQSEDSCARISDIENSCNATLFLDNYDLPSPEIDCLCSEENVDLWSYIVDCNCDDSQSPFYWQQKVCSNVSVPTGTPSLFLEFYPIKASDEISSGASETDPGSITLRTIPITRRTTSAASGVHTSSKSSSSITEFIPRPTLSTSNVLATALLLMDSNGADFNSLSAMDSKFSGLEGLPTNTATGQNQQNATKNLAPLLENPKPMLLLALFALL